VQLLHDRWRWWSRKSGRGPSKLSRDNFAAYCCADCDGARARVATTGESFARCRIWDSWHSAPHAVTAVITDDGRSHGSGIAASCWHSVPHAVTAVITDTVGRPRDSGAAGRGGTTGRGVGHVSD